MRTEILDETNQMFNGKRYGIHKANRYYKRTATINGKKYTKKLHREVWEYHNGEIPQDKMIDHIDRDRHNNQIENLRLVDAKGNRANISPEAKQIYKLNIEKYNSQNLGKWWQDNKKKKKQAEKLSKSWSAREKIKKQCMDCGEDFYAKHNVAKYCSKECRQESYFRKGIKLWEQKKTTK